MNDYALCLLFLVSISLCDRLSHVAGSKVHQIRGIPVSKYSLYSPDRDFECLDGSLLIPFSKVNDDYCDCADGTDEPGTPACSNGHFYCENAGYKPYYIRSSLINDRFCDCCDGSDEYASGKDCPNNCHDLGREARLEKQKAEELNREGNKVRVEMAAKGKKMRNDHRSYLVKLRVDFEEAELAKKEKELLKNRAEEKENAALEKYKPVEPEQTAPEETEEERELQESEAEDFFKFLDSDSSGTITIAEMQTRVTFDKDRNGEVSEEEAMFFLNNKKEINQEEFIEFAWATVKPFLMMEQGMFKPADHKEEVEPHEATEELPDHDKEEDDGAEEETTTEEHEKQAEDTQVQYDEETQALIDEATNARERFQEAEKSCNELLTEIRKLEEKIDRDYGPEQEFTILDGECFEYSDLEYIYTLCLFGKATQRSKSGGSDINLGHWNEWSGPEGHKYSKMKYDRGLACWNGPSRSTMVNLVCGKENKLLSVTEPSRCEYAMEFSTPALCSPIVEGDAHDEL
ncbi:hypothetical protein KM043_005603 [Ampulex compressa]|nr:hypothetical protein KM043_005603 [Ampulex compressa]